VLTLGIETSCDETSVAVVEDGRHVLSNAVSSQIELHRQHGGVVPELAARAHLERLPLVMDRALGDAAIAIGDVNLVAVTRGPGLIGALLVGVGFARALALERGLPIVGVGHLDGHLRSAFLQEPDLTLPMLVLIVSGGHTEIWLAAKDGSQRVLGRTLDDAAGEAFDKVARMLGLDYPGGPEIDRAAGDIEAAVAERAFPLPAINVDGLDFSFSGIKTAVRYALERSEGAPDVPRAAASFQHRAVAHLVDRLELALDEHDVATLAVTGGVARNRALRAAGAKLVEPRGLRLVIPAPALCTDNAAMIAAAGYQLWRGGLPTSLEVDPGLRLAGTLRPA
jgi:N6-L-threonylcarbamoyladenine synthase